MNKWRMTKITQPELEKICNDIFHPKDVSAEHVQEGRDPAGWGLTDRMTYKSQGGRRGRPWGWGGRRDWHLPLFTLLCLHWTPHPGRQTTHTHLIKHIHQQMTLALQDILAVLYSLETVLGCPLFISTFIFPSRAQTDKKVPRRTFAEAIAHMPSAAVHLTLLSL